MQLHSYHICKLNRLFCTYTWSANNSINTFPSFSIHLRFNSLEFTDTIQKLKFEPGFCSKIYAIAPINFSFYHFRDENKGEKKVLAVSDRRFSEFQVIWTVLYKVDSGGFSCIHKDTPRVTKNKIIRGGQPLKC